MKVTLKQKNMKKKNFLSKYNISKSDEKFSFINFYLTLQKNGFNALFNNSRKYVHIFKLKINIFSTSYGSCVNSFLRIMYKNDSCFSIRENINEILFKTQKYLRIS